MIILFILGTNPLAAGTLYWDANGVTTGAGSTPTGTWGSDSFWNTDSTGGSSGTFQSATTSSDDLYFIAGSSATSGNNAFGVTVNGTQSANSLNFQNSGGETLSSGTILLGSGGINAPQYAYGTTARGAVTISSAVQMAASQAFTNNGTALLSLTGDVTGTGDLTLRANSSGAIILGGTNLNNSGVITNSGSGTGTVTISAAVGSNVTGILQNSTTSKLALNGVNNSYAGTTTLSAGTLYLNNAAALGTGTLVITGGTLDNSSGATVTLNNNAQVWAGDFTFAGSNSLNTGSGNVTLTDNRTITVTNNTLGIGGVISGNYSLTKNGSGKLSLNGSNTFTGGFTLNNGTLSLTNGSPLGTGLFTINGGTIIGAAVITQNNDMAWNGSFTMGSGTGGIDLGSGNVTLGNNITVNISINSLTVGGTISDGASSYGITYAGSKDYASSLTLKGNSGFDGGVTISSGTGAGSGSSTLNIGNLGTSASTSALGTGLFTITGIHSRFNNTSGADGTLTTNNAQNWNGDFTYVGSNSLNMGTGAVSLGSTSTDAARTVTVSAKTLTIGGVISNGATTTGLIKAGAGTLVFSGANTYTGPTTVSTGILQIAGGNDRLSTDTILAVSGGASSGATFDLNGNNQTVAQLTGGSGTVKGVVTNTATGTSILTVTGTSTFDGTLQNGGSGKNLGLTKSSGGVLTLTGANTYTGATLVTGGRLRVNGSLTSAVSVSNGGAVDGTGTLIGGASIASGGVIGAGNGIGSLTVNGSTLFSAGGHYELELNSAGTGTAGTNWDQLNLSTLDISSLSSANPFLISLQTLTSGGMAGLLASWDGSQNYTWNSVITFTNLSGTYDSSYFRVDASGFLNSYSGNFSVVQNGNSFDLVYTTVPEPSVYALLISSVSFLIWLNRRARRTI